LSSLRRYAPGFTLALALICLYLYRLAGVGVLDPDEPRYLAIGRAMTASGDYITPRLWGSPWFEKPPLLYWLTSLGTALHLGPELCGRLPVAILSLAFLTAMFFLLRAEFGSECAAIASALLAASVGWLAYSSLALTDLPLAVFYSLAVFLALPLIRLPLEQRPQTFRFMLIGVSLGFGTLAKGLVPIVLALPFFWFLRRWWRSWWISLGALLLVALPWYLAVFVRNGKPFLEEFFWKHHFERVYSASLLHVQPWWYYLPVLLGALLPWTPLFGLLFLRRVRWDERQRFLAVCAGFGLLVFSVVMNKLPGYLLPLIPSAFALLAISVSGTGHVRSLRYWLIPCAIFIGSLPLVAQILPDLLAAGKISLPRIPHIGATEAFYIATPLAVALLARRSWTGALLVLCFVAGGFYLKIAAFPVLDRTASARSTWQHLKDVKGSICDDWLARKWAYGLALYRGEPYPPCSSGAYDFALRAYEKNAPVLVPESKR
jgi:4-amino-4-deoxy-L-arabinose transferase-like glycosyltransferase